MTTLLSLLQISDEPLVSGIEAMQKISLKLFFRLAIDFLSVFILVRLVYFRVYKRSELFFTFFIFNLVIFLICFLLNKVDFQRSIMTTLQVLQRIVWQDPLMAD